MIEKYRHNNTSHNPELSIENPSVYIRITYGKNSCEIGSNFCFFFEKCISCIPEKEYDCKVHNPLKYPHRYYVSDEFYRGEKEEEI